MQDNPFVIISLTSCGLMVWILMIVRERTNALHNRQIPKMGGCLSYRSNDSPQFFLMRGNGGTGRKTTTFITVCPHFRLSLQCILWPLSGCLFESFRLESGSCQKCCSHLHKWMRPFPVFHKSSTLDLFLPRIRL